MTINRAWEIDHYAKGMLDGKELTFIEQVIPELGENEVLIKTLLLSIDASNRLWLSETKDYLPQLQIGDVMRGLIIGRIEASNSDQFHVGEYVFSLQGWQEFATVNAKYLTPERGTIKFNRHPDIPLEAYASILGLTGWSGYVAAKKIGNIKHGDTVVVSGAAGATGSAAAQVAKALGAKVVGIAGSDNKCQLLTAVLKLDKAINYKTTDNLSTELAKTCPDGIDVFIDNVGGPTLDAALENMKTYGRVVISGAISQYEAVGDKDALYGVKNTFLLASKRLRMEGFLIIDHLKDASDIIDEMQPWLLDKTLQYFIDSVDGLENAQQALPKLFSGASSGKLLIKVA